MALAFAGGLIGVGIAIPLISVLTHRFLGVGIPLNMRVNAVTAALALGVAVLLGLASGYFPAYRASRMNIVDRTAIHRISEGLTATQLKAKSSNLWQFLSATTFAIYGFAKA